MKLGRRRLLKIIGTSGLAALAGSLGRPSGGPAVAQSAAARRFLHIMLAGGWDSLFATDPVVSGTSRHTSEGIDALYRSDAYLGARVGGKRKLYVGAGLLAAENAFATMPTAFVNGMLVEVSAHDLARNYNFSGRASLSLTREYPAIAALLGSRSSGFPAHVVLGGRIPLGTTATSVAALQAQDLETLNLMLSGPGKGVEWNAMSISEANALVATLDSAYAASLGVTDATLATWSTQAAELPGFYARDFARHVELTEDIAAQYGSVKDDDLQAMMAGAFLVLKSGMSSNVSLTVGSFDTHADEVDTQLPLLSQFAAALDVLVADLAATEDPGAPGRMLAETTTILVSSDFTRTPKLNVTDGTDHWQTGSAIVMGAGVTDDVVIGATDADGKALGWVDGAAVELSDQTALTPEKLTASLLASLGLTAEADEISKERVDGLFS